MKLMGAENMEEVARLVSKAAPWITLCDCGRSARASFMLVRSR
jgi:hypothetical protein